MRRWFAEEIRWASGVSDPRIISAFATIPRESFLPAGPWNISTPMMLESYQRTPDAEVHHLYHNVMVAIDSSLELNSALPSYLASVLEIASIKEGAVVAQVGAGLGYYSAILSHVVGPIGSILALEIDPKIDRGSVSKLIRRN
jgi:protein-L-isoaspartate(D-aspartate) O-methyltransferase